MHSMAMEEILIDEITMISPGAFCLAGY